MLFTKLATFPIFNVNNTDKFGSISKLKRDLTEK